MSPPSVLIVGGGSNSGRALRKLIASQGGPSPVVVAREDIPQFPGEKLIVVPDYTTLPASAWTGITTLVNCVGTTSDNPKGMLRRINVEVPVALASDARKNGVSHFIQISSLSVYGGQTDIDRSTPVRPTTAYGRSKLEAELALSALAGPAFMVTLLRVPILYGLRAGSKLRALARAMTRLRRFPVPSQLYSRSVLHIANLAVGILDLARSPAGGVQFLADPGLFSLPLMAEILSSEGPHPVRLFRLPDILFRMLKLGAPGVYASLYERSVIVPEACLVLTPAMAMPLREGLKDLLVTSGIAR